MQINLMETQINLMCAKVEEYIFQRKGVHVTIDRLQMIDPRQFSMLVQAYQIASGNKSN
jgi:hypothetical protein